ncbi:MAG: TRAP transporter substrate-binding protein [Sneathiellaceae bacterium]
MKRRNFLTGTAAAGATAAAAAAFPAPALSQGAMEWRMVTSWPKGLPGLGTGAQRCAESIEKLTGGKIKVKVYAGGELVPALGCFDAVSDGTAELGHDASYYHLGKSPACAFFTAVPYGMIPSEMNAWLYWGGGQELWDELYAPFNLKAMPAGNTGTQMAGWFRKPINSVADLKGLKMRIPGQGGLVMGKLGATNVLLPGGEIFTNLQSGNIDATEWVGPYNDLSMGFYQVANYYYWPGFHEPGSTLELMINKAKWDALDSELQLAISAAAAQENVNMLAEFDARSGPALQELIQKHGVKLERLPRDVLEAQGTAAGELMEEIIADGDAITKKVANGFLKARWELAQWTRISIQGFANARLLPFKYPRG